MLSTLLLAGSLALGAFAQQSSVSPSSSASFSASSSSSSASSSVSAETSVNIFLGPGGGPRIQYEASVVGVSGCDTTLALACTQGSVCRGGVSATITYGNNMYRASDAVRSNGIAETISISCSLKGTTEAACTESINAKSGSVHTHIATSSTFRGAAVHFAQVPVTAGASLLSSGSCSSSSSASSTSSSTGSAGSAASKSNTLGQASSSAATSTASTGTATNAAAPTGIREVYKVLVVPGAAALLAGALL